MCDREAFVAKIREIPADDSVRLVFADWLDENGEPGHAAFIREQIYDTKRQSRALNLPTEKARANLWDVVAFNPWEIRLDDRPYSARVCVDRVTGKGNRFPGVAWEREFIERVNCSLLDWVKYARYILAKHPVRSVWVTRPLNAVWYAIGDRDVPNGKKRMTLGNRNFLYLTADVPLDMCPDEVRREGNHWIALAAEAFRQHWPGVTIRWMR